MCVLGLQRRIPDPYGASILEPCLWWDTIEFEFRGPEAGVGHVAYYSTFYQN